MTFFFAGMLVSILREVLSVLNVVGETLDGPPG